MTIAAHIHSPADHPSCLLECMSRLADQNPTDRFIIFCNKKIKRLTLSNCTVIEVNPAIRNSLLLHYWYQYKLPGLLRKYNASVFISENGAASFRTEVPQVMLIKDLFLPAKNFVHQNEYRSYLKQYFLKFSEKAAAVCVTEEFIGDELAKHYPVLRDKIITVLHGGILPQTHLTEIEKERFTKQYAGGNHYFVCECSALTKDNVITVLKAFSIFKRRLKSGMQLVLLNRLSQNPVADFHNYKYRTEVQFVSNIHAAEEAGIMASAYAAIYLPSLFASENRGLEYMLQGTPLITTAHTYAESIYKDAAIYTEVDDKKLAEYLMILYKDETYRNVYVQKSKALSAPYNWADSSNRLWETILNFSPD